ncbi:hypothetical protein ACQ27_gp431 [Klebsiella phage K64-1]|nr:hypothetical protein ACQ27_gp431 [Klebsiella phage K64-1]
MSVANTMGVSVINTLYYYIRFFKSVQKIN